MQCSRDFQNIKSFKIIRGVYRDCLTSPGDEASMKKHGT
jgi:hypothetical protein